MLTGFDKSDVDTGSAPQVPVLSYTQRARHCHHSDSSRKNRTVCYSLRALSDSIFMSESRHSLSFHLTESCMDR